ncbi:hypothetical protein QTP70_003243 [Hemibagrus guttatus]|uniref:Reverse transcriptase domain-containing protein n=1 Tax=Hemibagrus guttatus TaxID=175788 RepID=A0AAE0Q7X4_9TELE|nr:hypothetical protein QTP70_003243 [Hemibagrus guttatus]
MDTLLSVFPSDSTPLTVLGDFNLPSDKLHSSGLLALLNSFSLSFNSCPPTHKEGNILDLVFTHPSPATDMTVTPLHISDHHLVSFSITLPVLPKRNPQHLSLTRRNLHSISPSSVASCTLSSLPDHESFSSLPLDSATDTLLSSLSSTMDFLCPLSIIRRKNSSPAPWLSDVLHNNRRELRSAARKWKKSKLDTDLTSYRTLLSKFSLDVTSAKTSFYKEKLETSAQDPRKLHNIFSSLLNPPAPPSPSTLTAEDFASFYTEKIERICQTFTSLPTSPTSHNQHSATPSLTQLSTVAAEEVLQITRSCNPTTCPLDPIPSAMLQTISPDLLPFITTVINGSLTSGHVPTAFKKARVIPILKKPALDPSDISNYRPVSLLSFLSKILERVVCNQLSGYLMQNNLHDPNQSGFKAAHSTETALLAVTEKLHAARSAKLSSVLILLDLSAAFDTVNHKTLLSTLRSLGICGTAWEWFASYLDGHSYQVTWKGLTSAPRRLSTGVPQGSVLGPLLFSLYTHSLGKVISSHGFSYHCYADDTQLIFSFPPSDTTASARISACLADISSWMTAHQLKLNPSKTELLIIPGDPSPAQDLAISLSNSMISPTASARNLGVTMDNQLSFSSHVTNVTRSCRFLLYNIRRIRPFLSTQATQVLVQSLVISRLDYCNSLLAGLPLNAIRPLQMIQNAAARLVFNLPKFSHITPLLRSLHWLPVAARIRFKTLMLAYKAKNGPAPSYLKALVTSRTAPRLLRSTSTARLVPPSLREKVDSSMTEAEKILYKIIDGDSDIALSDDESSGREHEENEAGGSDNSEEEESDEPSFYTSWLGSYIHRDGMMAFGTDIDQRVVAWVGEGLMNQVEDGIVNSHLLLVGKLQGIECMTKLSVLVRARGRHPVDHLFGFCIVSEQVDFPAPFPQGGASTSVPIEDITPHHGPVEEITRIHVWWRALPFLSDPMGVWFHHLASRGHRFTSRSHGICRSATQVGLHLPITPRFSWGHFRSCALEGGLCQEPLGQFCAIPLEGVLADWPPDQLLPGDIIQTSALIDSGAAVNLIDSKLVRTLCLPTIPCTPPRRITSINSQPIGGGYLTQQTEVLSISPPHQGIPLYLATPG